MKVKGKVTYSGQIETPNKKDLERGMRFVTVIREEYSIRINGQIHLQSLTYSTKTQDDPRLRVGETYLVEGKLWEMKNDDQQTLRGLTSPSFSRIDEDAE